jgi:2,4-dienoyl-CoA reductase-like NADH-dependent reductase (Old Yellow Enzyme family)
MQAVTGAKLFSPGKIGYMELRNRVVMAPMMVQLAAESGAVTARSIDYYARRAKGGAGLIIVEATWIASTGKAFACQIGLDRDALIPGHFDLVEAIHRHGAKVACQLHHGGARANPAFTGGTLVAPSAVAGFYIDNSRDPKDTDSTSVAPSAIAEPETPVLPRELTQQEIVALVDAYARAAGRAQRAGYDAVEIHGAHGYLIHQFLSPVSNRRTDEYGGSVEKRMRFAALVIRRVREVVGARFPILFRMSVESGYGIDEAVEIARALDTCGVDAIHVSVGGIEPVTLVPPDTSPMARPEGWLTGFAETIRKRVAVPVIVVGEIRHPRFAEDALAQGKADFIALARPLLADPDWPAKALAGRDDEIRHCISCDYCRLTLLHTRPIRCLVNPEVGREREFASIGPAPQAKRVIVVGGGPAGLDAARSAAARGHHVRLFERAAELGGQLRLAILPPHKEKIEWLRKCLITQAQRAGVELVTSTPFQPEALVPGEADAVVIATGAKPREENLAGARADQVVAAWDVLDGRPSARNLRVLVLGGRQMGCETAEFLAERGNSVTLISRSPAADLAGDVVASYRAPLLARLRKLGVTMRTRCDVRELRDGKAALVDAHGREVAVVGADLIVVARGSLPQPTWVDALRKKVPELYVVGDCVEPRDIASALYEGAWAGSRI